MSDRRRIISFEDDYSAIRPKGEPVAYKSIMGPGPCVRTMTWNLEDGSFTDVGEKTYSKTWCDLPPDIDGNTWYVTEAEHPLIEQARIRMVFGSLIKLWHDDIREPPDDTWLWARDNADAMVVLGSEIDVDILSMDHDLGGSNIPLDQLRAMELDPDYMKLDGDETGVELAEFIGKHDLFPQQIVIHSMNPVGAGNILASFQKWSDTSERNCLIRVEPFRR